MTSFSSDTVSVGAIPAAGKAKVEDLVKTAIKEALDKRKKTSVGDDWSTKDEILSEVGELEAHIKEKVDRKPVLTLKDGQKLFSDVIGCAVEDVSNNRNFPVTVFHDFKWDERIAPFIPEVQENYVIDPMLANDILLAWEINDRLLTYGPTGAGKSSLIKQLCALTSRPYIRINCTGDMDSSMVFGQLTASSGSTVWEDGAVTEAVKYGAVFAWDEWDVTPPEIAMGLQWLLEADGKLFLKEKPGAALDKLITPHQHFRLVALGNTQGQGDDTGSHAGTNVQNTATLDRFGTAVYIDYLPAALEEKMISLSWSKVISNKAVKELVKLAGLIRTGYKAGQLNLTFSPRTLLAICKKLSMGRSLHEAYCSVYLNKLSDTQRKVANELYIKIYGKVS